MRDVLLGFCESPAALSGLAIFLDRSEVSVEAVLRKAAEPLAPSKARKCARTYVNGVRILARKQARAWLDALAA